MAIFKVLKSSWGFISPHRSRFYLLLGLMIFGGLLTAIGDPLVMKFLVDGLSDGDLSSFVLFAAIALILVAVTRVVSYFSNLIGKKLLNSIHRDISLRASEAYYSQPYNEVLAAGESYHVSRLHEEPRTIATSSALLAGIVNKVVQLVAALVIAIIFSWKVTLALLLVIPFLYWLSARYGRKISKTEKLRHEAEATYKATLGRVITSYQKVHLFNLGSYVHARIGSALKKPLDLGYQNVRHSAKYSMYSGLYFGYTELAVILFAGAQVISGGITIGTLFGFLRAYQIVMQQVNGLAAVVPQLARIEAAIGRYEDYIDVKSASSSVDHGRNASDGLEDDVLVAAENISLGYGELIVLKDLSISIKREDSVLISGANGTGKSTLAAFLTGFMDPVSGSWARIPSDRISASFNNSGFIPGAVIDSFAGLPDTKAQRSRNRRLFKAVGMDEFLDRDPTSLSQGQMVKLQVVLALAKDADLYLFDEPLANVDTGTNASLADLIRNETRGKAIVVITHGNAELFGHFNKSICVEGFTARAPHLAADEKDREQLGYI